MVKRTEVLTIIPARGGSKGIPRKNIRDFAGYPLIAYSIAAAHQAQTVTRTIVSTDDVEIAEVAKKYGAEVPFIRPGELAQDQTTDLPVFQHALSWLSEHENYQPEVVVHLRPTSPIRPKNCIDEAVRILLQHPEADAVRAVVRSDQNPYKMWRIDSVSGQMWPLLMVDGVPEPYNAPRQSLPETYWQAGHVDVMRPSTLLEKNSMTGSVILPLIIDNRFTADIDTPQEWQMAEWMVYHAGLDMVLPAPSRRLMPEKVALLVLDFDGVLTDNRVWVNEKGEEAAAANRSDSLGLHYLRQSGVKVVVISTETNPVVTARCKKLDIPAIQGVWDKEKVLQDYLQEQKIDPLQTVYVGNDINDLSCFQVVGFAAAPADALPEVRRTADLVLSRNGGYGAVREICDLILRNQSGK